LKAALQSLKCAARPRITEQTFYRWKRKFAAMGVAELARLRQLEDEHKKLQSLVADLTLDKHMLQEVLRKKF
jgi:putative transposase